MARRTVLPPSSLSRRDRAILSDLARVRLLTGSQLERLHFSHISTANARGSARRRSLGRLVTQSWVTTLPRRVGGERAGSAGLIYSLDSRAHRDRPLWDGAVDSTSSQRIRRPWAIGWMFVRHTLDVAELYVRLREAERRRELRLMTFDTEPASWFSPDGGAVLKPDAYVVLENAGWERHWWIEVDRSTESLPTLRRKLGRYVAAYEGGVPGPDDVLPRVLVTVPTQHRADQVRHLAKQLQGDAGTLLAISRFDDAAVLLPGEGARPPPQ